jgi:DNA-binding response OmpR family regulator
MKQRIVILGNSQEKMAGLAAALEQAGGDLQWADSLKAAQTLVSQSPPDLVVIDERVDDLDCIQAAHHLVMTNALVNLAAVSALPDEDFHNASEGLGILARLSPAAGVQEAIGLLEKLSQMQAIASDIPSPPE